MPINFEDIDFNKVSSKLLNEYATIKLANRDFIVFFQVGEFFETYFLDAKILSETTGVVLSSRKIKEVGDGKWILKMLYLK